MTLRVAVLGTGFGSSVQIPGFRRLEGVEVVAVASARLARAREVATRFDIPHATDDYRALLDAVEVDLVSVVGPPSLHHEMVMEALRRGKHVLCEKPFALSLAQAREMLQAAERAGVVHALDHEFRFLPARIAFTQLVAQGYLGEPWVVRVVWQNDQRARAEATPAEWWWYDRKQGGGVLGALGSHYVDSLRCWFGEVREVSAVLDACVPGRALADGSGWRRVTSDDTASLLLRLGTGTHATISLCAVASGRRSSIEACGSAGTLVLEDDERLLGARGGELLAELPVPPHPFPPRSGEARLTGPFAALAGRVVAHIHGQGSPDFPTFREGAAVQAVLDAAYRAAETRRWVEPEPVEEGAR